MVGYYARVLRTLLCISAVWIVLPSATTFASGSWTDGDFTWGDSTVIPNIPLGDEDCHTETKIIIGVTSLLPESGQVCVYERPNFRYGVYRKEVIWYGTSFIQKYFVVSIGSDRNMYVLDNFGTDQLPIYVAGSNDLHITSYISSGNNQILMYIDDFPTKLQRIAQFGQTFRYQLAGGAIQPFIPNMTPTTVVIGAVSASQNGKWMAVEIKDVGLVRINTEDRSLYGFSNYVHQYNHGYDASIVFTISDDGTKIAAFDNNILPAVYALDESCALLSNNYDESFIANMRTNECPNDDGRLYAALRRVYTPQQAWYAEAHRFNDDGDTLYFNDIIDANERLATVESKPLHAGGFIQGETIEYLALGDSFTSGEGDIEKAQDGSSYYLPGTEANNECHISSRSYPFLLREQLNIADGRMHTIACSGAQVLPDYIGSPNSYVGQGAKLSNLDSTELTNKRTEALQNFTSGIVTQLEFVKKYQPKAITIMGGGNDVGFASILEYCASPAWEGVFVDGTCGYAVQGHILRTMLGQSIQSQYQYTLQLLRMVRQVSPDTTVYVVGYPSFISEDENAACLNSAVLDADERTMINDGVTTMNSMLEAAASSMGVKYIDIQDSLVGGRLCEGSEYVTGLSDIGVENILNKNTRESFHPNALGHAKMTQRMLTTNFHVQAGQNGPTLANVVTFNALTIFGSDDSHSALQRLIAPKSVVEQSTIEVRLVAGSLEPGSVATLTMFSTPTLLGQVTINSNGGVNEVIMLPGSVKPGRHVIVIEGKSPSGEPLYYYQFITVLSQQPNDGDNDGIVDSTDTCLFIVSWIDEATNQDVCLPRNSIHNGVDSGDNQGELASTQARQDISSPYVAIPDANQSASNSVATDDSKNNQDVGEVRGARIESVLAATKPDDALLLIVAGVGLSTLFAGYGILKAIRSRP